PELSVGALQPMGNAINVNFVNLTSPQVATRSIAALRRGDQYANQLFSRGGNCIRPGPLLIGLPMPGRRPRRAAVGLGRVEILGRRLSIDPARVRIMTPPGRFIARMMTNSVKSGLRSGKLKQYGMKRARRGRPTARPACTADRPRWSTRLRTPP